MVIPSTPGLPLFRRTRFHALTRFSRLHTSSINCSVTAGLSGAGFATNGSVPWEPPNGVSPRSTGSKASTYWICCRFPLMSRQAYLPLPVVRAFGPRSRLGLSVAPPFGVGVPTSLADGLAYYALCCAIRRPLGLLSRRNGDTRQISRGKLNRLRCTTAGSTLRAVDGYGLRDALPARPTLAPRIRFLSIRSHLCFALPSDPASRR